MRHTLLALLSLTLLTACQSQQNPHLAPIGNTQPVPLNQVEDATIWIHPTDPAKSLLFICNKIHGIEIHDTAGFLLHHDDDHRELAGIDVLYNFPLKDGPADLLIAASPNTEDADRPATDIGVRLYQINPLKPRIHEITPGRAIQVLNNTDPLGIVACHTHNNAYFFVTSKTGLIEQYQLSLDADHLITATKVRSLTLPGKIKAGVADESASTIYFASEKQGLFALPIDPQNTAAPKLIIPLNTNGLTPDLTGLTLYTASHGQGYLIVVSQKPKSEPSSLYLFNRAAPHNFITHITLDDGPFGGVYSSSGITVTNLPLSKQFPAGLLALKNRINPNANEDYKLFSWQSLATKAHLLTDTTQSPRTP